jgi:maltose alpha-D-glucosyltransferase / alpha-amylase
MTAQLPAWLAQAVFYQIYPQSFYDASGDGIGDLAGIEARLDYLADLGVNALWINPCYVSPFKDAGYDVVDHCRVAPRYGTNEGFVRLLDAAHARGIRICLELVAGHTSDQHPWFVESQRPEPNEFTHRYVWTNDPWIKRDGDLDFVSGASDRAGSYAVNVFTHQPALNYGFGEVTRGYQHDVDAPAPKATRAALQQIMKFWLDLGVDGFRVDLAGSLVKHDPHRLGIRRLWREIRTWLDDTYQDRVLIADWGDPEIAIDAGFHVDFMQHVGVPGYDALLLGPDSLPARTAQPYFDSRGAGDFQRFWTAFDFQRQRIAGRGLVSLPTSNHDFMRPGHRRDAADLKVLFTFLLTWPHLPCIYYGDEIGMRCVEGLSSREGGYERTGSRTPMQWDTSALAGFSTNPAATAYLPIDPRPDRPNVASQRADRESLWHHVERLIYLRVTESDLAPDAPLVLLNGASSGYPLVYRRGAALIVAINPGLDAHAVTLPPLGDAAPVLSHRCHVSHGESGWQLRVGPRGYGVFTVR